MPDPAGKRNEGTDERCGWGCVEDGKDKDEECSDGTAGDLLVAGFAVLSCAGWACASAKEELEFSRIAAKATRTHDAVVMVRIDERRKAATRRFFARLRSLEAIVGADLRKRGSLVLMQAVDQWYSEAISATATEQSIANAAKAVIAHL